MKSDNFGLKMVALSLLSLPIVARPVPVERNGVQCAWKFVNQVSKRTDTVYLQFKISSPVPLDNPCNQYFIDGSVDKSFRESNADISAFGADDFTAVGATWRGTDLILTYELDLSHQLLHNYMTYLAAVYSNILKSVVNMLRNFTRNIKSRQEHENKDADNTLAFFEYSNVVFDHEPTNDAICTPSGCTLRWTAATSS